MRLVERVGDLLGHGEGLIKRERAPLESRRERLALDELHDEKVKPFSCPRSWSVQMCG